MHGQGQSDPLPPSTKRVWRLKKYTKSTTEIEQEQQQYADLEFSPKKSSRRPKNRPGEQQEFVFVDLSPQKKKTSPAKLDTTQIPVLNSQGQRLPQRTLEPVNEKEKDSKGNGLSRLFRLSSQGVKPQLLESPELTPLDTTPLERPARPQVQQHSRSASPLQQIPQLKRTPTPQLVMTVSSTGRAVLQPSSASSSTTDLFSLHSHHRSPSPKREADSPLEEYDSSSDDNQDACRAFERAVSRRKRANTAGSTHSIARSTLSRTSSVSSIYRSSSIARMSPSRAAMLRQNTPVEARPPPMEDFVGSFFDDAVRGGGRPRGHLRQQKSISTLGPALGMEGLPELNDPDVTLTKHEDDLAEFFDFSAFGEEQFLQDA